MKKRLLGTMILVVSTMLFGCSSKSGSEAGTSKESSKIVWAGWSGEEESTKPFINDLIHSYNSEAKDKVKWVGWPWKDTQQQLIIRNQGSEQLDVAQVDINMFGALAKMGLLEDINTLLGKKELSKTYEGSALKVGQVDGKQLGVPWSVASIGMVYNPTILKKAGYDNPPKTIAEFEDCMAKIKAVDPDIIPYGVATKEETMATDFQPWLWTFGGKILKNGKVTLDSSKTKDAMNWYKELLKNNYIQMNMTRFDARQLFAEGKLAFYDDAISAKGVAMQNGISEDKLAESIQPMERPVLNSGDNPQAAMWGHLLVVFKKSKNKEEALSFIKFVTSEKQALKYLNSNGMPPVVKSALSSDEVKADTWTKSWLDYSKTGQRLEFTVEQNGSELNNILVEELQGILLNKKSVDEGITSASKRIEEAINQ